MGDTKWNWRRGQKSNTVRWRVFRCYGRSWARHRSCRQRSQCSLWAESATPGLLVLFL